jgi:hypothetical protein
MSKLSALSEEKLAEMFADLSRQQGTALENEDMTKYNKLYRELAIVAEELRSRGNDARKILVPLLAHSTKDPAWSYPAAQVRFNAAVHLKAVVPDIARATLEALSSSGPRKYRGMAGMSLSFDEQGISKPT